MYMNIPMSLFLFTICTTYTIKTAPTCFFKHIRHGCVTKQLFGVSSVSFVTGSIMGRHTHELSQNVMGEITGTYPHDPRSGPTEVSLSPFTSTHPSYTFNAVYTWIDSVAKVVFTMCLVVVVFIILKQNGSASNKRQTGLTESYSEIDCQRSVKTDNKMANVDQTFWAEAGVLIENV